MIGPGSDKKHPVVENFEPKFCMLDCDIKILDMARYGPFNNPQKIVGSCNLGNLGNFWHEMANSKIAKSVI